MGSKNSIAILALAVTILAMVPDKSEGGGFVQGQCGQTIRDSIILTADIGPCTGTGIIIKKDGITLDGDGHKILGSGGADGLVIVGKKKVTLKNFFVQNFERGIVVERTIKNNILMNSVSENGVGLFLSQASETTVTNNVIAENTIGISANSPTNKIFHNSIINNEKQIQDVGGNTWEDLVDHLGNFWGNYWGEDDGSNGRTAGDFVGDTLLPHEGVDFSPVMDGSKLGLFLCGDWWGSSLWLVWRGGWSPVEIQLTDPQGRTISRDENQIGIEAFYMEDNQVDPNRTLAQIIILACGNTYFDGVYSFQMTGLDDLTYSMTHFVAYKGDIMLEHSLQDRALADGETQDLRTRLDSSLRAQLVVSIDIKPGSDPNTINISSAGVIPIAILSSPTFDATMVDPDSVSLELATVKMVGKGKGNKFLDINSDGLMDLVCQVLTDKMQIDIGESILILRGNTFGGTAIHGQDFVRIVSN